jgi:AcrR family transcriptional regulator
VPPADPGVGPVPATPPAPARTSTSSDGTGHGASGNGRPRNAEIDRLVLEVALRHLRSGGLPGLSVAAVAEEAGTTRAAVYRRWSGRTDLAVAALGTIAHDAEPAPSDDPFDDLVAELERFRRFVATHDATALVAVALLEGTHARVCEQVREQLLAPRHGRLRSCLQAGVEAGALRARADRETAEDLLAGSWLAHALRGEDLPDDWAHRTASMVWAACGGVPHA